MTTNTLFRSPRSRGLFDHIWTTNTWKLMSKPQVFKICNEESVSPFRALQPLLFNFDDADESIKMSQTIVL